MSQVLQDNEWTNTIFPEMVACLLNFFNTAGCPHIDDRHMPDRTRAGAHAMEDTPNPESRLRNLREPGSKRVPVALTVISVPPAQECGNGEQFSMNAMAPGRLEHVHTPID